MSSNSNEHNLTPEIIFNRINDYTSTISAIYAFINVTTWDNSGRRYLDDTYHSIGRRMQTSPNNSILPNETITPDIIIQQSSSLGYVTEVKSTLGADREHWVHVVEQMLKYDDELTGWWTQDEGIDESCMVLLIHATRSAAFENYMLEHMNNNNLQFEGPASIIEFSEIVQAQHFIHLRKSKWGNILDDELNARLEEGIPIPLEHAIRLQGAKQFYDAEPITEHTMQVLWMNIFNELHAYEDYNETEKAYILTVHLDDLVNELQLIYGSVQEDNRAQAYPRRIWVKTAMEAFVQIGLAKNLSGDADSYEVLFKELKGDIIERFSRHRDLKNEDDENGQQLNLFGDD